MTAIYLIRDLASALREVVKDFEFEVEQQTPEVPEPKKISVYEQYLPTDMHESDNYFPYVLVSVDSVESARQSRKVTLNLQLAVFGGNELDGYSGWRDLFNLAERIMQFIDSTPVLAKKYSWQRETAFIPAESQKLPWFYGNIVTEYAAAEVQF